MQTLLGKSLLERCLAVCPEQNLSRRCYYLCTAAAAMHAGVGHACSVGLLSTPSEVCFSSCLAPGTLRLRRCTTARAEFEQELARVSGPGGGGEQVVLVALATVVFLSQSYRPTRIPAHVRELLIAGRPAS